MTTLVFNSGILTIATESWAAVAMRKDANLVQVHLLSSPTTAQANLEMTMDEFMAIIADGSKIIDLRKIQK